MAKVVPAAPASWWRPPLGLARLLDALASDARAPVGIIAAAPESLAPALLRLPTATCFTVQPWSPQSQGLLPTVGQFVGIPPLVAPLIAAPG
ncbi:MAG TPA: hypothetical protein VGP33_02455, partial [Chloroflexota bacterium]|nr:hypothetical protein [Chloroflexota bacterium]